MHHSAYPKKKRDEVLELRRRGMSLERIAAQVGIGKSTASRWVEQAEQDGLLRPRNFGRGRPRMTGSAPFASRPIIPAVPSAPESGARHVRDCVEDLFIGDHDDWRKEIDSLIGHHPKLALEVLQRATAYLATALDTAVEAAARWDEANRWDEYAEDSDVSSLAELMLCDVIATVNPLRAELLGRLKAAGVKPHRGLTRTKVEPRELQLRAELRAEEASA